MAYIYKDGKFSEYKFAKWKDREMHEDYLRRTNFNPHAAIHWGGEYSSFEVDVNEGLNHKGGYRVSICIGDTHDFVYVPDMPSLLQLLRYLTPIRETTAREEAEENERHRVQEKARKRGE